MSFAAYRAFGLLVAVVELKAFIGHGNALAEFCQQWFPFLTVIGGKGAFCVFAGSLGLVLDWLVFVPACFVIAMGVLYVLFHFGQCGQFRDKYRRSTTIMPYETNNAWPQP